MRVIEEMDDHWSTQMAAFASLLFWVSHLPVRGSLQSPP